MSVPITLSTTPTCPDCRALKTWLDRQALPYTERDLGDPAVADEARARSGVRIAPITVIGDQFFYGTFPEQRPHIEAALKRRQP